MFLKGIYKLLLVLILFEPGAFKAISSESGKPKDTVVILASNTVYIPFTFLQKPSFQVINNQLNLSITDRTGDMIQINGIDIRSLKSGIQRKSGYRVVYISQKRGTLTDDKDVSPSTLLEIKCADTKPGSAITIGLKSRVGSNTKNYRIYATLSGNIPIYTYQNTLSK